MTPEQMLDRMTGDMLSLVTITASAFIAGVAVGLALGFFAWKAARVERGAGRFDKVYFPPLGSMTTRGNTTGLGTREEGGTK